MEQREEIWLDIRGYKGLYQISNLGRVKSLDRIVDDGRCVRCFKGQILIGTSSGRGYISVMLSKNGITRRYLVHRLVAEAFIPNPHNYPCINHINEDKTDNRVENLEWCDYLYNNYYNGRMEKGSKKKKVPIIQMDMEGNELIYWFSGTDAATEFSEFRTGSISKCCRGKIKYYKGFKWKYAKKPEV